MNLLPLALLLALGATPASSTRDTVHLVVVATTDVHGHVFHWDYIQDRVAPWGLTRAATVIDSLRQAYPGQVIVVDAGDLIQGDPFATFFATVRPTDPHPVVDALNAVGYDVATPGNHEFNWGLDVLARALGSATFAVVSGNIYRLPRDTLAYAPYTLVEREGVRVGVTGFTTPGVMVWDRANVAGRVKVRPILQEADRVLRQLDQAGADLRVVVIHSGMDEPSSYDTNGVGEENVAARLATLAVRPDLVVVGHSHKTITDTVINGVHFIQPPPHARGLAVAHLWLVVGAGSRGQGADGRYRVVRIRGEQIPLADVRPDPVVSQRLAGADDEVRTWVDRPVARVEGDWSAWYARAEDTPIIDFVNYVQRRTTGADLSSTAAFNPHASFGPGDVRLRDVAGLYPYENRLKAIRIDGAVLKAYLEQSAAYFRSYAPGAAVINDSVPGFNYDIVSGVDYALDLTQPVGSRVRQLTYRDRLVQATDTFTLALNDYRQGGGGGFGMLRGLPVVYDGSEGIRDLLADYLAQVGVARASDYFEPSWRITPPEAAAAVRAAFGAPPPPPVVTEDRPILPDTLPGRGELLPFEAPAPPARPVATLKAPLDRDGANGPLGQVIADAFRTAARAHVALAPAYRVARGLPGGPVFERDLEAVLPDPQELVTIRVTGRMLADLLEAALTDAGPTVSVSGVEITYDPRRKLGDRIRNLRFPDGRAVRRDGEYLLALPGSMTPAGGGVVIPTAEGTLFVFRALARMETDITELEALDAYLKAVRQPVEPPSQPRFRAHR